MKPIASDQKLRGGYYTPPRIAAFLADWAVRDRNDRVLEPSSGDGIFLESALRRLSALGQPPRSARVQAVEIDPVAAGQSASVLAQIDAHEPLHEGDFFEWAEAAIERGEQYDVALGNPPFLRFAYFKPEHREPAFRIMRRLGLHPNKLTNAWVPFVAASAALLSPTGRLAMVVPAELLQVTYAAELRGFLADFFDRMTVVAFDRLVFGGIQQEVVLIAAERRSNNAHGISVVELVDDAEMATSQEVLARAPTKVMDHSTEKWTQYFLDAAELELVRHLRSHPALSVFKNYAEVDVGVVTGMNDFFLVDANGTTPHAIKRHSVPIIHRSNQLQGAAVTEADWSALVAAGAGRLLLSLDLNSEYPQEVEEYLASGVERKVHEGYKCRIRKSWFVVPSRWEPAGFMHRQIHMFPKLAINEAGATSTDTVHRVRFNPGTDAHSLIPAFHNAGTFLMAEVLGRSYGGGVLELEPTEAEALPVPYAAAAAQDFEATDMALRAADTHALLAIGDRLLQSATGLGDDDVAIARRGWASLRNRRQRRNRAELAKARGAADHL